MPMAEPQAGSGRYIIRSDDSAKLNEFIKSVVSEPGMTLVDVIGPTEQPHTAVVEMSHDKARSLEQQFRNAKTPMIIEPDRPLSLFNGA
jgi:rRNA processing protein Gar1